mgnify:CR=1 FL=1
MKMPATIKAYTMAEMIEDVEESLIPSFLAAITGKAKHDAIKISALRCLTMVD